MSDKTKIEWTDATWNPIRGCSRVSEGCRNCYAETVAHRFSGEGQPYEGLIAKGGQWNGVIKLVEHMLDQPLRWQRPRRIFVNSMSDLFHEGMPDEWIDKIFAVMALCPRHTFQILTKRPERMLEYFSDAERGLKINRFLPASVSYDEPLKNVWLGVSVEDQKTADERIPLLLQTPAAVRWISAEPLLGDISLRFQQDHCDLCGGTGFLARFPKGKCFNCKGKGKIWITGRSSRLCYSHIDWVVVGGESGKNARPMHPDWARSLRDQCQQANVPFLFKQWGEFAPNWFNDADGEKIADSEWMDRMGKKAAGRMLDGRLWDEYPK